MQRNATPRLKGEALWACPLCHRVTRGLFLVSWCSWLVEIAPTSMCGGCLEELRSNDVAGEVWDVRVQDMRGAPLADLLPVPAAR